MPQGKRGGWKAVLSLEFLLYAFGFSQIFDGEIVFLEAYEELAQQDVGLHPYGGIQGGFGIEQAVKVFYP